MTIRVHIFFPPLSEGRLIVGDVNTIGGQEDVGEEWPVEINTQESCEYWINPRFQTCLDLKHLTSANVFLHDGRFYARGKTC